MTAFKKLTSNDVIVTPFIVEKNFDFRSREYVGSSIISPYEISIDRFFGLNITGSIFNVNDATTGISENEYQRLVYNSVKQLYYTNYLSSSLGDLVATSSIVLGSDREGDVITGNVQSPIYENYLQSSLPPERYFPTSSNALIGVISIPSDLYGEKIKPSSFVIQNNQVDIQITDNGDDILYSGSLPVGNVFYSHGLAVITGLSESEIQQLINGVINTTCSFTSTYTIYETQYKCTVNEKEFNLSTNPSLISGSDTLYNFATGSVFTPYVTTVGFYNEAQELLMVGKLAKPLPTSRTTDTTIVINIDK